MDADMSMERQVFPHFNPDWSHEEALAAGDGGPHSPYQRWCGYSMLAVYEAAFEEGDKLALFEALRLCAIHGLSMPQWVSDAYVAGYKEWRFYRRATLDEAFGVARKKGTNLRAKAKAVYLNFAVPVVVRRLQRNGRAIDDGIFDDAGKELNISSSSARKAYYSSSYYKLSKKRMNF